MKLKYSRNRSGVTRFERPSDVPFGPQGLKGFIKVDEGGFQVEGTPDKSQMRLKRRIPKAAQMSRGTKWAQQGPYAPNLKIMVGPGRPPRVKGGSMLKGPPEVAPKGVPNGPGTVMGPIPGHEYSANSWRNTQHPILKIGAQSWAVPERGSKLGRPGQH